LAARVMAVPLATCSQQPWFPHPHSGPAAADPGADPDEQQLAEAHAGAEPELPPRGRVGVVVGHRRHAEGATDAFHQRRVAPRQVRREPQDAGGLLHESRRRDPDRRHLGRRDRAGGRLHRPERRFLFVRGRRPHVAVQDRAGAIDEERRDLRAADVDAHGVVAGRSHRAHARSSVDGGRPKVISS
jgi:hypothetical protein